ncbi:MAG: hypothetical protein ACODAJ_08565, partial [Planctomycetota bacterium]
MDRHRVSRRELIRLSLAGAAAMAVGCRPEPEETVPIAVEPTPPPEPEPAWTVALGIQSYSLRHFDFAGAVTRAQQVGLHYV